MQYKNSQPLYSHKRQLYSTNVAADHHSSHSPCVISILLLQMIPDRLLVMHSTSYIATQDHTTVSSYITHCTALTLPNIYLHLNNSLYLCTSSTGSAAPVDPCDCLVLHIFIIFLQLDHIHPPPQTTPFSRFWDARPLARRWLSAVASLRKVNHFSTGTHFHH